MTRSNAIQIIHIAKGQLALDDDTYRSLLGAVVPGKSSCREMLFRQWRLMGSKANLSAVLSAACLPRQM